MALKCTGTKKKACFCTAYNGIAADGNVCKSCKHPFANHTRSTAKAKHDSADDSGDDHVWEEDDASDNDDDDDDDEDTHRRPVAEPKKSVRGILSTHSIKLKPVDLDTASFLAGQKETSAGLQSGKTSKRSGLGLIDTLDSAADKTMKELGKPGARKSGFTIATIYMLPEGLEESTVSLPRGNKGEELVRHGLVVTSKSLQRDMDFDESSKKAAPAAKPKATTRITRSATQGKNPMKRRFVSESSDDDKPKKRSKVRSPSPVAGPSKTASRSARSPSSMLRTSKVVPTRAQTPPCPFSGIPPPPAVGTFSSP